MNHIPAQIAIACLLAVSMGQMQAQIVTDRPDQTESSSTVGNGNLQLETGLLIGFEGENEFSSRQLLAPTILFRYGITEGIELRILSQLESIRMQERVELGISDLEAGVKIQLFRKEESRFEAAFISHLLLPTGSEGIGNESFGTINKLAASHELSETLGLGYNLGYSYFGTGRGMLTYSAALGVRINEKVGIYAEPYGEVINVEEFLLSMDTGLTFLPKDNLQFDLSFGTGVSHRMNYISVGCSWKIMKAS